MSSNFDRDYLAHVSARLRKNRKKRPWAEGKPVIISYVAGLNTIELSWKGSQITSFFQVSRDGVLLDGEVTGTTYIDSGLEPDHVYLYEVDASYKNLYFSPGSTIEARTVVLPQPQWTAPGLTSTSITLSWTPLGVGFKYVLSKDGVELGVIDGSTYTVNDLLSSTLYTFEIRSIQSCQCTLARSPANTVSLTTSTAPAPSTLTLKQVGVDTLLAFWEPVPGVLSYVLERDGVEIYSGPEYVFSDEGLAPDTEYSYRVRSVGGTLASTPSGALIGRTNTQVMKLDWSSKPDEYVIGGGYSSGFVAYGTAIDVNSQQGFSFFGGGSRWKVDKIRTAPRWPGFTALATAIPGLNDIIYQAHVSTTMHYMWSVGQRRFTLKSLRFQPGLHIAGLSLWGIRPDGTTTNTERVIIPPFNPLTSTPQNPTICNFQNIKGIGMVRQNATRLPGVTNDQGWPMGYGDIEIEWL